jgi:predicted phosphohydrolase
MLKTLGNVLILTGILMVIFGFILKLSGKFKWIGKLPGDIVIHKGNFTFYFPLVTGLLASLILSLLLYLIFKFVLKN